MSTNYSYIDAPNLFIQNQNGKRYAYRELGEKKGIPIIFLHIFQLILIIGILGLWMVLLKAVGSSHLITQG